MANPMIEIAVTLDRAMKMVKRYLKKRQSVMLWGPYGIGKSEMVHQLGAELEWKVIDWRANLRETVDLRGIPVPDLVTGTTKWLVPDELPRVDRDGEEGILFLDELVNASPQMQAALYQLVQERKCGDYQLPPGWRIVAAGNRVSDRSSAQRMPVALRDRFAHITVVPDVDAWVKWANCNGVAPEVVAFIRFRPENLHRAPQGDENCFPTPRSLVKAAEFVDEEDVALRQALFAGHLGADVAGELNGFIGLYQSLGTLEDIIANPTTSKIPTERSQLYAVSVGLARKAARANFAPIVKYVDRLPRESQAVFMHDACVRDAKLKETAAYSAWAVANSDLILQA